MANATQYLNVNYPSSNRSSIINLDLSNKNFVGDLTISGFVNLQKLNYSFNNFNGTITLGSDSYFNLEELDSSSVNNSRDHTYSNMTKLIRLKLSKNGVSQLYLSGCSNLAYLNCNNNLLRMLDLSNSEKYVEVNCSNNPFLSNITYPSKFVPDLFDCRNTNLGLVIFSNSSVFDCQKNTIIPQTIDNPVKLHDNPVLIITLQDKEQETQELENADKEDIIMIKNYFHMLAQLINFCTSSKRN
ncbi:2700_t:CDS:2 [Diversispora eburnea]|uniref:2700_t:CDS:1 n=1 Tax=Diversispora eburnea TaxID=1213867 RepID=A0A9N8VAA1_9GLOM|nr:2700_t:CDS:2 [Diversispora eburnea]